MVAETFTAEEISGRPLLTALSTGSEMARQETIPLDSVSVAAVVETAAEAAAAEISQRYLSAASFSM